MAAAESDNDSSGNSYIDFGAPNISTETPLYLDVLDDDPFWSATITGFYLSTDSSTLYALKSSPALTDTGTSFIFGPTDEISSIKTMLKSYLVNALTLEGEEPIFSCDNRDNLPDLYFALGDYWFEVTPEDYAIRLDWSSNLCVFAMEGVEDSYWTLGTPFLRGYYLIHDYANMRQGFVTLSGDSGTKSTPVIVTDEPDTTLPGGIWFISDNNWS